MPIRIAIAGKGGTGKTTISALLCRSLIKQGVKPLLAVDADPNSCLHEKVGVRPEGTIGNLREELRADPEKKPNGISKNEWIENLINQELAEAIGFDLITMGRQEGPDCYCYINNMLRQCLEKLGNQYESVVIDNEAGLEHLSRRSNGSIEHLLVVCQATVIGARTAKRIMELVESLKIDVGACHLILNACDSELSDSLKAEFSKAGLDIAAKIPTDSMVLDFELEEKSLLELPDDSGAALAVDEMVSKLIKKENS
jgi:CO dehydrogenase maturation factor